MSRSYSPGERRVLDTIRDEQQHHNRTYVGQVQSVNTRNGTIDVATSATGKKEKMVIPILGMSVNGFKSSWIRYMPQSNDFVKVSYSSDNRPQAMGMAMWGNDNKDDDPDRQRFGRTEYHQGGYARVARLAEQNAVGMSEFTELLQGEWDMRSSGGAYLKGSRTGVLQLAAGSVGMNMRRERNEVVGRAGLVKWDEGNTTMRLGSIKRQLLPKDFEESEPAATGKEWLLQVGTKPAPDPTPGNELYEEHAGDIRQAASPELPLLSPISNARYRQRVYIAGTTDDAAITATSEAYLKVIDDLGNVDEVLGVTATAHNMGQTDTAKVATPTCVFNSRYLSSTTSTLTTNTIDSDVTTNITAGAAVFLGSSSAIDFVVKGTTYRAAEDVWFGVIGSSAAGSLTAAGTELAGAANVAVGPLAVLAPGLSAAAAALNAAGAALVTGLQVFNATSAQYLSTKVRTE